MIAVVLTEVVTAGFTPIECLKDCDAHAGLRATVLLAVVVSVLAGGGLIMTQWRDMIFVAAVSAGAGYLTHLVTYVLPGVAEAGDVWGFLVLWAICLLLAFAIHGLKRMVLWLVGHRAAPT
jgi:hypothetical protein